MMWVSKLKNHSKNIYTVVAGKSRTVRWGTNAKTLGATKTWQICKPRRVCYMDFSSTSIRSGVEIDFIFLIDDGRDDVNKASSVNYVKTKNENPT